MDEEIKELEQASASAVADSALVEALLFASSEPLSSDQIAEICNAPKEMVEITIQELSRGYEERGSGFEIAHVAEKYQLRTRPVFAPYIRAMRADRPRRISTAALETLAVVAYRQPVVKSDMEKIRGVDVTPTLKTLIERGLVRIVGHQSSVGQPALYGTTEEFLSVFGLKSLGELPTLRDIKEFERDPGEYGAASGEAANETTSDQPAVDVTAQ